MGGLIQTLAILEGEIDWRETNKRIQLAQFLYVTFKSLQLWHNMWLTFLIHCTVHMSNMCAPTLTPGSVHTMCGSLNYTRLNFISSHFSFRLLAFCCFNAQL